MNLTEVPEGNWLPTNNGVFIVPEIEEKTGSIWRPRMAMQMPSIGIVKAIARGAKANGRPVEFKVGDRVVYDKHHQFLTDDRKLTLVNAEFVLAVYEIQKKTNRH